MNRRLHSKLLASAGKGIGAATVGLLLVLYTASAYGGSTTVEKERSAMGGISEETFFYQESCRTLAELPQDKLAALITSANDDVLETFCRTEDDMTCTDYDEFIGEWGYLKVSNTSGYCKLVPVGSY